ADFLCYPLPELVFERINRFVALFQGYEGRDRLPFNFVRSADDGCFRHLWMRHQRRFHFHGAQAMAGDVDDIVNAPHDPEIPVLIFAGPVAGEVNARYVRPVLLHIAIRVSIDSAEHRRPWPLEHEKASRIGRYGLSLAIDYVRHDAREGPSRRA